MPYDGNGNFTPVYIWVDDANNDIDIRADRMDGQDGDISTGLSNCITRDGQSTASANLPMGGFRHIGASDAVNRDEYVTLGQLQDGAIRWLGTAGGTANAITLNATPALTVYTTGAIFYFLATATNSDAVTFNVNALGTKTIKKYANLDLEAGDIVSGQIIAVMYDGTNFQLIYDLQKKNINMAGKLLKQPNIQYGSETVYNLGNISGAVTVDYSNGHVQYGTLTGNITSLTVSNWPTSGKQGYLSLFLSQDGTGSRTLTLSSSYKTIGGVPLILSTPAGTLDELILRTRDAGTTIYSNLNKNYQ